MLKNVRIAAKLLFLVFIISTVPLSVLSLLSYNFSRSAVESEIYKKNAVYFSLARSKLNSYFLERKGDAKVTANVIKSILFEGKQKDQPSVDHSVTLDADRKIKLDTILKSVVQEYGYSDVFVTDSRGVILYATVNKSIEGADHSRYEHFQKASRGTIAWSDLIYSDIYRKNVMILSAPIYEEVSIIGTVNFVVSSETINDIVHNNVETIGSTADSYLISLDGTLYSTTKIGKYASQEVVLKERISTHAQKVLSEKIRSSDREFIGSGVYKDYRGVMVVGVFGVVQLGDKLVGLIVEQDEAEAFDRVYHLRNLSLSLSFSVITFGILIGVYLSKNVSTPIKHATEIAEKIATCDLTSEVSERYLSQKDEAGRLIKSIHDMQLGLCKLVSLVNQSSKQVNSSAQELAKVSEEMNDYAKEMLKQMEEIDKETQNTSSSTEEVTSSVEEVSASAQSVSKASQDLSEKAKYVERSAKEGKEAIKIISEIIVQTREKSTNTRNVVRELSEKAKNIGEIVQTINSIAEQTNLLALNAAIEAARAGEAGRGFAVVADEIRKLAEESKKATGKIGQMLVEIQRGAELASEATSETSKVVERAFEQSDLITKQFGIILQQIEEITKQIENLAASVQEQSAAAQEISSAMDSVMRAITRIAQRVTELTRAFKQISDSSQIASASSEELSRISQNLVEQVEKFKIQKQTNSTK